MRENKIKQKDLKNIYESCQRDEKAVEHEEDSDTNRSWSSWNSSQKPEERLKEMKSSQRIETIKTTAILKSDRILRILES